MSSEGNDFIVSELLSELKNENNRKSKQIQDLHKVLMTVSIAALTTLLLTIVGFLLYLNQYDFTSYESSTAEGIYAIVDSEGNVISADLTAEEIEAIMKGVLNNGEIDESTCP